MSKISQRPVAKMEQPIGPALVDRISWDDLKLFMAVAYTLSFRKAATSAKASSSTIVRRIERLEDELGLRLFDRLPDGVALTAEGQRIFSVARDMERASNSLRAFLDQDPNNRGVVRCAITEGLGTFWILPHLAEFNRANPFTIVDLICSMQGTDVLRMKADLAMETLTPEQLLADDIEQRLLRLFGDDEVRVFSGHDVVFECRCSRERVANVLRSLGQEEVRSVIAEQGSVTVTCEFCQKPYKFDPIDAEQLFADAAPRGSDAIN